MAKPPRRKFKAPFVAAFTIILWLITIAPLATLVSWLGNFPILKALLTSLLAIPPFAWWTQYSVQSANVVLRWPTLQIIGASGILMSVVIFLSPLLFLLPKTTLGVLALLAWLVLLATSIYNAQVILETPLTLSDKRLDKAYKVVHLSDVHAGSRSARFIARVANQVMRQQPDFVLITGDLLDSSNVDKTYLRGLSTITCPIWMCLGNHERYVNLEAAITAATDNGVKVLRNESADFGAVQIIGIDDADKASQVEQVLPTISVNLARYTILMYHRPDGWDGAIKSAIDLTLCGHTHAGQIWPFGLLVKRQFPRMAGLFTEQDKRMYVSQGTGTWGPTLRLGTRSEMTIINLKPSI